MTKSRFTLYFFTLAVFGSIVLRFFQLTSAIDHSTGLFTKDSGFLGIALYIVFAVCAAGFIVFGIIDKKRSSVAFKKHARCITVSQQSVLGIAFLLCGCGVFTDAVKLYGEGFSANSAMIICSFFGAAAFVGAGFFLMGSRRILPNTGYFLLVLSVFYTYKAANLFISHLIISRLSIYLIEMFAYIFTVLFLLSFGRFLSRGETKNNRLKLFLYAGATGILSGVSSVPAILVKIFAAPDIRAAVELPSYGLIALFVLSCCVMSVMFSANLRKPKKLHIIEETIEPSNAPVHITDEEDESDNTIIAGENDGTDTPEE